MSNTKRKYISLAELNLELNQSYQKLVCAPQNTTHYRDLETHYRQLLDKYVKASKEYLASINKDLDNE